MSTPTPTTTAGPAAPVADPVTDAESDDGTEDGAARKARREAKGLRDRLREAESAHDALEARVAAYERDHLSRLAEAAGFADPRDAFDLGVLRTEDPALRADDGTISEGAVTTALKAVLSERGHLSRGSAHFDQGAQTPAPSSDGPSWDRLFR